MTNKPKIDPSVAVLTYDGLCTFEFGIAVEVFGLPRPELDVPWYDFRVVAAESRRVRAVGGVVVETDTGLDELDGVSTIIIPGWRDRDEVPPEALIRALQGAYHAGARILSICSGVFVLAATGLLDGRRATTHWRHMATLAASYPEILIEKDVLYVDEGRLITSAGSAAGIDAALHLVRRDYGASVANSVARRLVMAPHRDGGQAQYVPALKVRSGPGIADVMDWARGNLHHPIDQHRMAAKAHMGLRTFQRRFQAEVGSSPMQWLQRERITRAQALLETGPLSLEAIAERVGYASPETFRVAFRRVTGTSPAAYRARFSQQRTL